MKTKPKIAVIGLKGLPAFGGAATVGENIIEKHKDKYHFTIYAIDTHTTENEQNQIIFKGSKIKSLNTFSYYIKSMLHCLFVEKYDLIHLHHAESGFITPFLRLKYKVIVTFHGIFYDKYDPKFGKFTNKFFKWSEKLNLKYANIKVSVSKNDADVYNSKANFKLDYIPNGINIANIQKIEQDEPYMVFAASRIYEIKGLHILLKAIKKTKIAEKLIIIGDLFQVPEYKKQIEILTQGLNIEFLGLIKNKAELFKIINNSKLFIFPSLYEAMSMMLLEVVSLKTPVIASRIPANEAIFNNQEVLFFDVDNETDLAEKLLFALSNPSIMLENAEKAYHKLEKKYTWDVIAQKYENLFNSLIIK